MKSSFRQIQYPVAVKDENEIAEINKFIAKSKALVLKYLGLEQRITNNWRQLMQIYTEKNFILYMVLYKEYMKI